MTATRFAFNKLVEALAEGEEVPLETVIEVITAANKTAADLMAAVNDIAEEEATLTVAAMVFDDDEPDQAQADDDKAEE
jgi:hypothetical protein